MRAAAPGQTVLLPCPLPDGLPVDWRYRRHYDDRRENRSVTHNGHIVAEFSERFRLDKFGLIIREVQQNDQGIYICVDLRRHARQIQLFVPCK